MVSDVEHPNLDQVERETSALLGRPTPMHSRKKLQKKETSAPIPKKYLEYEVSQGPMCCCVRGRMLFLCKSLWGSQGVPGQDKRRAESEKKKEKYLKPGLNPGSIHPPGPQLSYPPWWGP